MKDIDISRKISFWDAFWLPFRISPFLTFFRWINIIIKLILAPLDVLAVAKFIDASLNAINCKQLSEWKQSFIWLGCILLIKVYYYIEGPISSLVAKRQREKEWEYIDYPAIKLRASLKMQYFENDEINNMIVRNSNPGALLCNIEKHLLSFFVFVGKIISFIVILLMSSPLAGVIITFMSVPVILFAKRCALAQYKIKKDITKSERLAGALKQYMQNRECVSERTLFSYFKFINEKFKEAFMNSRKAVLHAEISWGGRKEGAGLLITALCAITVFMLMPSVKTGALSIGLYITLIRTVLSTAEDIAYNLSPHIEQIVADKANLQEYGRYVDLCRVPEALLPLSTDVPAFESLVFEHVSFKYPGTDHWVLKDVSFKIEAGKRYSIIGVNGCGKSTIVKLILRFYDEYSGRIILNGRLLSDWKMADIKAMMTTVFQEFVHYDLSLEDNISVGHGLLADEAEIDRAMEIADLVPTVLQLPKGKKTLLGKISTEGIDLSGGQWQKVAVARAAISHSTLKIFDEPTAALDPIAERNVYVKFDEISKGATSIFISHRLASCLHADEILLLDDGIIAEQGSHVELMKKGQKYKMMFDSQKEWYT